MTIELQNPEKAPTDLPSLQLQQMMMMMRPKPEKKSEGVLHAVYQDYTPLKLTWNRKMMVLSRNLLFQGFIFRFHVSFLGCI